MKIGITGGIGSGKTYVAKALALRGIEIYDCDNAAKRLIRTSAQIKQELTRLIGPDAYLPTETDSHYQPTSTDKVDNSGSFRLNKAAVSRFLLASEANAKAIDSIVHPAVFQDFINSGMKWMESAILFESGIYKLVDRVLVVTAPEETRITRVMARDNITRRQVLQWMERQLPQDEVRRRADFEIVNDGLSPIDEQISHILKQINTEEATITDSINNKQE